MNVIEILENAVFIWFFIGLVFSLLEFVLPGLISIFFGLGGFLCSISCAIFNIGIDTQILIFILISTISLLSLRKYIKAKFFDKTNKDSQSLEEEFIGETAIAITDFVNGTGKVEFKGTQWQAFSDDHIQKSMPVLIQGKKSIKLIVKLK